jgi:hypothetical protein
MAFTAKIIIPIKGSIMESDTVGKYHQLLPHKAPTLSKYAGKYTNVRTDNTNSP